MSLALFLQVDFPALLIAILTAVTCSLIGNFLVLRHQALIGDALSHAVFPGMVLAYAITGSLASSIMLTGALFSALIAVIIIELIRRLANLEAGAAMGVTFTSMFAAGIIMLERLENKKIHLDVGHALYGNLEITMWNPAPSTIREALTLESLSNLPHELQLLGLTLLILAIGITIFFKELKITSFDANLAQSLGIPVRLISTLLMIGVAMACVAAFQAVGSILVIAMLVCPPATARMLTDRLTTQIYLSLLFAIIAAVLGYWLAAFAPSVIFNYEQSLSAAGMMALIAGLMQIIAMLFAPNYGKFAKSKQKSKIEIEA